MTSGLFGLATFWWVGAGILIASELATGTFYLLMLAIGFVASAIAAHIGFAFIAQIVTAAVIGGCSVGALWFVRRSRPREEPARSNRAVNLDIGNTVEVPHWDMNSTARVNYRGANWEARFEGAGPPSPGEHVITAMDGNVLVVGRKG